ncbi:hypothetical protein [Paraburkholderia sp. DHOC27]|uniref:hypothetical protein n=1 Tax=Paraburkholderia sp. DHOC27 TaxID=2303330 RepID=UPI000E3DBD3E|nr:hypothetical protein [Paraburkholderia sp. DHOC27]RFU45943.1 hypothetical protein D0B32_19975 [Paraburkholderia sp. DHOC27]
MYRFIVLATGLLLATSSFAGQPAAQAAAQTSAGQAVTQTSGATPTVTLASVAPAPDKVYPPLPTLAMIPPPSDDDLDTAPRPTARKKKVRAPEHRLAAPPARLVVSDASRAYLGGIEKQLDLALDPASTR